MSSHYKVMHDNTDGQVDTMFCQATALSQALSVGFYSRNDLLTKVVWFH